MYEGRVEKGLQYESGKKPIKWEEHKEVNCAPCGLLRTYLIVELNVFLESPGFYGYSSFNIKASMVKMI